MDKVEAAAVIELWIQPEHAVARTVIDGRVLTGVLPPDTDELHIHLDTLSGPFPQR
jgi:hypothetical protein